MSRSGYSEDGCDDAESQWASIRWRGAVKNALRSKRGQAFLREMLAAMDALPVKRLVSYEMDTSYLEHTGDVCALGSVTRARGIDVSDIDMDPEENPDMHHEVAATLGMAHALACEVMYWNDEGGRYDETPEQRFARMRRWIERQLIEWEPA